MTFHRAGRFSPKPESPRISNLLGTKEHGDVLHLPEEEPKSVCSFCCFSEVGLIVGKPRRAGGVVASPPLVELGPCVGHPAIDRIGQLAHLASQRHDPINRGGVGRHRRVNLQQQSVGISVRRCHGGV